MSSPATELLDGDELPSGAARLRQAARLALADHGSSKGGPGVIAKDVLLVLHWVGWYAATMFFGQTHDAVPMLMAAPLAISLVAVMFGVMHDGSHRTISDKGIFNRLGSWTLIIGGASAISWRQEHVVRHHGQTNILHEDPDLDTGGWLRFHPSQTWRRMHRWQAWYAPFLYTFVSLRWIWFEDFDDLIRNRYEMKAQARLRHSLEIILAKVCHILLMLVIPMQLWDLSTAIVFYLVHMAVVSVVMTLTFVSAHVGECQSMFGEDSAPRDWAHAQLASTANFAVGNRPLGLLLGGLNFQIEHHLFPNVSPRHYPRLLPVVQQWAAEEGLAYNVFPTVRSAVAAHFRHLGTLGVRPA